MHFDPTTRGFRIAPAALLACGLALGCTWVPLSTEGQGVHVRTAAEVARCDKLGATHSKTSQRAGIFARNPRKVDQELEYLARNEAAAMGGDTVVPRGPTTAEGRRSFDVYRCGGL